MDPNIKAPYSHEASAWLERQLTDTMGVRAGFVYKTEDDLIATDYQPLRPASAYNVPFTFVDLGVDGVLGNADDKNLTCSASRPRTARSSRTRRSSATCRSSPATRPSKCR